VSNYIWGVKSMILESNVWELYFSFVGKNTPLKERLGLESIDMVSGT